MIVTLHFASLREWLARIRTRGSMGERKRRVGLGGSLVEVGDVEGPGI